MKIVAKVFLLVSLIVPSLLLITGCSCWPRLEGSDKLETREIDCSTFVVVEISDAFEADIIEAEFFSLRVTADDNLFPYIEVKQNGYNLSVGLKPNRNYLNTTQKVKIEMPLTALCRLKISEASKVNVSGFALYSCPAEFEVLEASSLNLSDLKANSIQFNISGASQVTGNLILDYGKLYISEGSKIELEGCACDDIAIDASGSSSVELAKFYVTNALVNLSEASIATINARRYLGGNITGASILYLIGNPIFRGLDASEDSRITAKHPVEPLEPTEKDEERPTFSITIPDPERFERTTLEEISTVTGITIPLPTYLPPSWDIEAYVGDVRYGETAKVYLIFADRDIKPNIFGEVECIMTLQINWPCPPGGLKITPEMYRSWEEGKPYYISVWQTRAYEAWMHVAKCIDEETGRELTEIKNSFGHIP